MLCASPDGHDGRHREYVRNKQPALSANPRARARTTTNTNQQSAASRSRSKAGGAGRRQAVRWQRGSQGWGRWGPKTRKTFFPFPVARPRPGQRKNQRHYGPCHRPKRKTPKKIKPRHGASWPHKPPHNAQRSTQAHPSNCRHAEEGKHASSGKPRVRRCACLEGSWLPRCTATGLKGPVPHYYTKGSGRASDGQGSGFRGMERATRVYATL